MTRIPYYLSSPFIVDPGEDDFPELVSVRVQDAISDIGMTSSTIERESLLQDIACSPSDALPIALTELHAIAAYLYYADDLVAWHAHEQSKSGTVSADELAILVADPELFVKRCPGHHPDDDLGHLALMFDLAAAMALAWPADVLDSAISCYLDWDISIRS